MKKFSSRVCAIFLTITMMISMAPMSVLALTAKEQEDFYRVNTWWQDEYNQQYIDWLLESDNFMYHLDMSKGNIIHDVSYGSLNLDPKQRKDNFVEILTSFIGLSYDEIREQSAAEAYSDISVEFLDGFKDFLEDTQLYTVDQFKYMEKAINETSDYYLSHYYGIDTDMGEYGYQAIYERIQSAFDNNVQDFDWPDRKAETMQEFYDFVHSSEWHSKLSKASDIFDALGESVELANDGIALIGELESYNKTDERLVEFLKYIRAKTNDSALKAACDEIIAKFGNSYSVNIIQGILQIAGDKTLEWTFDNVKQLIPSHCGIYAIFAKIGITAGNVVSDLWFNTTETKQQMQMIYCLNHLSELLAPLLQTELQDLYSYDEASSFRASYAADAIYHMSVLIELRKKGEESYYKLKDSVYGSSIIEACKTLGWGSFSDDQQIIEAWYSEFTSVIDAVKGSLYKMIPTYYYYKKPEPAEFEKEGERLIAYNGDSVNVYIPTDIYCNTIDSYAFNGNEIIQSVNIPYTIKTINANAFYNCSNLKSITINSTEAVIADGAFVNCHKDFTIYGYNNSTAQEYAIANSINFVSFDSEYENAQDYVDSDFVIEDGVLVDYLGGGGDVYIPYGVTAIGSNVFAGYANNRPKFNIICLPDTVVSISSYAFQYCDIQSLTLGNAIADIDLAAFDDANINQLIIGEGTRELSKDFLLSCTVQSLELPSSFEQFTSPHNSFYCTNITGIRKSIYVDPNNSRYSSVDGILYDKLKTSLLFCPAEKEQVLNIPQTVTSIRRDAFRFCNIDKLKLPTNITQIEQCSFSMCDISELIYDANIPVDAFGEIDGSTQKGDCESPFILTTIKLLTLGETVSVVPNFLFDTFNDNSVTVESINLGSSVKVIGDRALTSYDGHSISIPKSVTHIGYGAFAGSSIKKVYYNAQTAETEWSSPFGIAVENVVIGSTVLKIPDQLFYGCENLQTVQFLAGVVSVGESAFKDCVSLAEVRLPETVTTIETRAFSGCTQLEELVIPSGVTTIGYRIIEDCEKLKTLTYNAKNALDAQYAFPSNSVSKLIIGEDVESLDDDVFAEMTALQTLVWSPTDFKNTTFPDAFGTANWVAVGSEFVLEEFVGTIKKLIIESNVTVMPYDDYGNFQAAMGALETIDYYAKNCIEWYQYNFENITTINIKDTVETLPDGFLVGTTLQKIEIPANVKSVGLFGLSNSEYLQELIIHNEDFAFAYGCFENCPNLTIYSYSNNSYLVYKCKELQIPFVALCKHNNLISNIIIQPSCSQTGMVRFTCSDCDYFYDETLPIKHKFSEEWTIDIPATCTSAGSKSRHCLSCDEKTDVVEIPVSHIYQSVTVEPTCTMDGSVTHTCEICLDTYEETLPASHQWSTEWTVDVEETCTTVGSKSHHCLNCAEKTDVTEIPAVHQWPADWTVDLEPTETTEGSKSRHCTRCDAKTDVTVIPMLSAESPATDFEYSIRNNEVTINAYIGTSGIMNIPTHIEGYPVTTISAFAFSGNATITKATIPYTVTNIKYYAFNNCSELLEVNLGSGITVLPESLFSRCGKLQKVSLPTNLTTIQSNAFYYCESLVDMSIPDSVEIIEDSAFYKCLWYQSMTEDTVVGTGVLLRLNTEFNGDVVIPDGVHTIYTCIGQNALTNTHVGQVTIPASLIHWDASNLWIDALKFNVHEDNPVFVSVDGALYTKDMTTIVAVPTRLTGTFIVPDTVTIVGEGAFYRSNLSEVVLPDGVLEIGGDAFSLTDAKVALPNTVITIGEGAFGYNESITEMVIPSGVITLEGWTFNNCISLVSITIPNSIISIGAYAFNGCTSLISITIPESVTNIGSNAFGGCNNLVINGYTGSFAETYAAENNIPFVALDAPIPNVCEHSYDNDYDIDCNVCGAVRATDPVVAGDVDGDGEVTLVDAALLQQYLADWEVTLDEVAGDTDGDGEITLIDVALLQQYLADWNVELK